MGRDDPPPQGVLDVGSMLGRYRVLGLVGSGGMGDVYACHDDALRRSVAIKRLRAEPSLVSETQQRLRREAMLHGPLVHENIVRVHDLFTHDGLDHLVMEYVEGETLGDLVARGAASFDRAAGILVEVARGLRAAHEAGIVHRDLKPENVLLGADGSVKITDFGVSRSMAAAPSDPLHTQPGGLVGTYRWMSPEQTLGRVADASSDVFTLGVLFYWACSGALPWEDEEDLDSLLAAIRGRRHRPLRERVEVPREVSELVDRMLDKSPGSRPLLTEVEELLAKRQPPAVRTPASVGSRKRHVAMLFVRAQGRGAPSDLEALHRSARALAERHEATVVYGAGAELLLCVGDPHAHENNTTVAMEIAIELLGEHGASCELTAAVDAGDVVLHEVAGPPLLFGVPVDRVRALGRAGSPNTALATLAALSALGSAYRTHPWTRARAPGAPIAVEIVAPREEEITSLVGPDRVLTHLRADWRDLVWGAGEGRVTLLVGEAGIGKSRVVRELLRDQPGDSGLTVLTRATAHDQFVPFQPIRELLRGGFGWTTHEQVRAALGPAEPIAGAVVASLAGTASADDERRLEELARARGAGAIEAEVAHAILRMAQRQPLRIVLEDLHWADHSTRAVVHALAAQAHRVRLHLIVTSRPDEALDLLRDFTLTRLNLERLSAVDVEKLVSEIAGDALPKELAARIAARSERVPLRVIELTRYLVELARAGQDLGPHVAEDVPAGVRDLVQHRMQAVAPGVRAMAQVMAVLARPSTPELVAEVRGEEPGRVRAELDVLARRGILRTRGIGRNTELLFQHPLLREAVYEEVPPAEREALHRRALDVLEGRRARGDASAPETLAFHAERAGEVAKALGYLRTAADGAMAVHAYAIAERHLRHAIDDLLPRLADEATRQAEGTELYRALGRCLISLRGLGSRELEVCNARLAELAGERPRDPSEILMRWGLAYVTCDVPRLSTALGLGELALADPETPPPLRPILEFSLSCFRGITHVHLGLFAQAKGELAAARGQRDPLLPILTSFPEHNVITAPVAYAAWVELLTGREDAMWKLQEAEEAAYPEGGRTHLTALAMGMVLATVAGAHAASLARSRRVLEEGPGRGLLPGHLDFASLCLAVSELRAAPAAATEAALASLWDHFTAWQTLRGQGEMLASSIVQCALVADACADVIAAEDAAEPARRAARAQARRALDWAAEKLVSPDVARMHAYYVSEVHRVRARLALLDGRRDEAAAALDLADRDCDTLAASAGEEPRLLRERVQALREALVG